MKIENHDAFMSKNNLLKALKTESIETFEDIWSFCVKNGADDLQRIPGVGVSYSFDLISESIKYKNQQFENVKKK